MRIYLAILVNFAAFAQSDTKPPEDQRAVLTATGKGVQIYTCQNAQWVFQAPEATLFDSAGKEIGTHGAAGLDVSRWPLGERTGDRQERCPKRGRYSLAAAEGRGQV